MIQTISSTLYQCASQPLDKADRLSATKRTKTMTRFLMMFAITASSNSVADSSGLHYVASMDQSTWNVENSAVGCQLTHPIPHYGTAIFSKTPEKKLQFVLKSFYASNEKNIAYLESQAAAWQPSIKDKELGTYVESGNNTPFQFSEQDAIKLLNELHQGRQPTFIYRDRTGTQDRMRVSLSTVQFGTAQKTFQACLAGLLPFGYTSVQKTHVNFGIDKATIPEKMKPMLDKIATFSTAKTNTREIIINGHTDWSGSDKYNMKLSEGRTQAVMDYLVNKGVSKELIRFASFGEKEPLTSNYTAAGRKKNRRVSIEIVRN